MNLLLDTGVVLWCLTNSRLRPEARSAIANPDNAVWVSAVTIWEISIKKGLGKLTFDDDHLRLVELVTAIESEYEPLDVSFAHALQAGSLPPYHRDPFDRMLVSQAQVEGMTLVSRDRAFAHYDVSLLSA